MSRPARTPSVARTPAPPTRPSRVPTPDRLPGRGGRPAAPIRRRVGLAFAGLLPLLGACSPDVAPETVAARRGPITESFTEPAQTRLDTRHTVRMPVDGRLGPVTLRPGDAVEAGRELAAIDLVPLQLARDEARARVRELEAGLALKADDRLEATVGEEARAMVDAMDETLRSFDEAIEARAARDQHLQRERLRMEELAKEGTVSERDLDDARVAAETSLIELRQQQLQREALAAFAAAVRLGPRFVGEYVERKGLERAVIEAQLAQARARLAATEHELDIARVAAPIDGVVLERLHRGDAALSAGDPLLLIGDPRELEVEVEVLTEDALRLAPGGPVELEVAHRDRPYRGEVARIEPMGFTKLSSLGVEQQRVRVIVRSAELPGEVGVAFRVRARFLCAAADDALLVPRHAVLSDPRGDPFVLVAAGDGWSRRAVTLGLQSDAELQVVAGLDGTERLMAFPDADVAAEAP